MVIRCVETADTPFATFRTVCSTILVDVRNRLLLLSIIKRDWTDLLLLLFGNKKKFGYFRMRLISVKTAALPPAAAILIDGAKATLSITKLSASRIIPQFALRAEVFGYIVKNGTFVGKLPGCSRVRTYSLLWQTKIAEAAGGIFAVVVRETIYWSLSLATAAIRYVERQQFSLNQALIANKLCATACQKSASTVFL